MGDLCALIPLLLDTFDTLGLSAPLLKSITEMGFETPTDIQAQAIPLLLEGDRDFIGLAQTGTGKTAAFGLPLLDHLDTEWDHVQALVLAPTRELFPAPWHAEQTIKVDDQGQPPPKPGLLEEPNEIIRIQELGKCFPFP